MFRYYFSVFLQVRFRFWHIFKHPFSKNPALFDRHPGLSGSPDDTLLAMGSVSPIYPIFASRRKSSKSREIRITKRRKRRQRQQRGGSRYRSFVAKCVWCFFFVAMIALSAFEFHESKGIHFSNHRYWRIPCGIKGQIKSANTAGQVLIMKIATVSVIHGNMWKAWNHESIANKKTTKNRGTFETWAQLWLCCLVRLVTLWGSQNSHREKTTKTTEKI